MKTLSAYLSAVIFIAGLSIIGFAQTPAVQVPRLSPRAEVVQTVGDVKLAVVYYRPNKNGREVWGKLVPYNEVWRTGANENTVFEISEAVKVNGKDLPAGKYGLHTIPGKDEWIIIFNKVNDAWGSFTYDQKNDALRVTAKPYSEDELRETMKIEFETVTPTTAQMMIEWDKVRVPITIDAGDVSGRVLAKLRDNIGKSNAADAQAQTGARILAVNFVLDNKIKAAYPEANTWADEAIKNREGYGTLRAKARLSAESGDYKTAANYGDKALAAAKTAKPAVNPDALSAFEKTVAEWKAKKQ